MKISKLIEKLQEVIEVHGDIDVVSNNHGCPEDYDGIDYIEDVDNLTVGVEYNGYLNERWFTPIIADEENAVAKVLLLT